MVSLTTRDQAVPDPSERFDESQLYWLLPWHGHTRKCTGADFQRVRYISPLFDLPQFFDPQWTYEHHRLYAPRWYCGWVIDDVSLARFAVKHELAAFYDDEDAMSDPPSYITDTQEQEDYRLLSSMDVRDTTHAVVEHLGTLAGVHLKVEKSYTRPMVGIRGKKRGIASMLAFYDNYERPDAKQEAIISTLIRFLFSEKGEEYRKLFYIPDGPRKLLWFPAAMEFTWYRRWRKFNWD